MGRNRNKNISAGKYRLEYCYLLKGALQDRQEQQEVQELMEQQDRQEQLEVQEPMEQQGQQEQQEVRELMEQQDQQEERVKNNIPKTNSSIHVYYTKYYSY